MVFLSICSRPSRTKDWDYDFFVDFDAEDAIQVENVVQQLRKHTKDVCVIGSENTGGKYKEREKERLRRSVHADMSNNEYLYRIIDSVVWFPRKLADLDTFAEKVMEMGEELSKIFQKNNSHGSFSFSG